MVSLFFRPGQALSKGLCWLYALPTQQHVLLCQQSNKAPLILETLHSSYFSILSGVFCDGCQTLWLWYFKSAGCKCSWVPLMLSSALLQPFEQNFSCYKMEKLSILHKEPMRRKRNSWLPEKAGCVRTELYVIEGWYIW